MWLLHCRTSQRPSWCRQDIILRIVGRQISPLASGKRTKLRVNHIRRVYCLQRINLIKPYQPSEIPFDGFLHIIYYYTRGFAYELPANSGCPRPGPYNVSFYKTIAGNASITIKEQIAKALLQIKRGQFTPNNSSSRRSAAYCIHICRINRYISCGIDILSAITD